MKSLIDRTLTGLRNSFRHKREERVTRQHRYSEILSTVEKVVDGTDSRIRLVNGYRKKLYDGVETALVFTDELVRQIPGVIEISSTTFVSNPYVNAFFANVNNLHEVFSHSSELLDFIQDTECGKDSHCCVLLCMQKTEKTVLGMQLSGSIVKKDVKQTAVNFSDHRIYSPASTETEIRKGLRECLLGGLINNALERIMQCKVEDHQLQNDHRMLHAKLRHLEYSAGNTHREMQAHADLTDQIRETRQKLRVIEDKLMNARPATPEESLNHVNRVLRHPEHFIRLQKSKLRLDKMGIRTDDNSSRPCNNIELTEVAIGEERPRVVTLATFPLEEISPAGLPGQRIFHNA